MINKAIFIQIYGFLFIKRLKEKKIYYPRDSMTFFGLFSILINISLVLIILVRSPNEQSLQENVTPFKFFESSRRAEKSIDNLIKLLTIQLLTILYFLIALVYVIQGYF